MNETYWSHGWWVAATVKASSEVWTPSHIIPQALQAARCPLLHPKIHVTFVTTVPSLQKQGYDPLFFLSQQSHSQEAVTPVCCRFTFHLLPHRPKPLSQHRLAVNLTCPEMQRERSVERTHMYEWEAHTHALTNGEEEKINTMALSMESTFKLLICSNHQSLASLLLHVFFYFFFFFSDGKNTKTNNSSVCCDIIN